MYPRKIELDSEKLEKLLTEKGELVKVGRIKSEEIEKLEISMDVVDKEIQEAEKKVKIDDLLEEEKAITKEVEECIVKMKEVKRKIFDRMNAEVPKELHEKYDELKKAKDEIETERNKIALKAQKFNDKIIPLGRKLMKPYLQDEFEDYDTLRLEDGKVVATIFSHLNDFRTTFINKKQ